ncbi:electron transfer flavoprotein subunit alpha/FixB family protein, partial [Acinetobacter baumannii]
MSSLVLVEHNNHTMHPTTRNTLAAALELNSHVTLLVVGHQCEKVVEQAAVLAGVHS